MAVHFTGVRLSAAALMLSLSLSILGAPSCAPSVTGQCNVCGGFSMLEVTAEECEKTGEEADCESAALLDVTDDACDVGKPATTHQACVYENCSKQPSACVITP